MTKFVLAITSSLFLLLLPGRVDAQQVSCEPIYGGGQSCQTSDNLKVEKTIQNPKNGSFVNSLTSNEDRLQSGQNVIFRIVIQNTSEKEIRNIDITERLPGIVTFTRGDGNYNKDTREVTLKIDSLAGGQSRTLSLTGKLGNLPSNTASACYANYIQAKAGNQVASDLSQFCLGAASTKPTGQVQSGSASNAANATKATPTSGVPSQSKGGQTVYPKPDTKEVPNTGPELFALIPLLPAAAAGFYIRKKA